VADWEVHLTYSDDRSNKFWRARVEDSTLYINFGRIGSDGQTQVKELGSYEDAVKQRDKVANQKRKKGYVDEAPAEAAIEEVADEAAPTAPQTVDLAIDAEGRKLDVRLVYEADTVRTVVVEHYDGAQTAAGAFLRVKQAMLAEGYKVVQREDL